MEWVARLPDNALGLCTDPAAPNKTIFIKKGMDDEDELTVLIHEMLHAGAWDHDEEWVDKLSQDIARLLLRLGWKRDE